jgi:hypothetical protein
LFELKKKDNKMLGDSSSRELSGMSLNPDRIHSNADLVQKYAVNHNLPSGNFWDAIQSLQHPEIETARSEGSTTLVFFEPNSEFGPALAELMGAKGLDEFATVSSDNRDRIRSEFAKSLQLFSTLLPKTYSAFIRTIAFVIVGNRDGYGGGTISNRLGLIWLSPSTDWTSNQWIEWKWQSKKRPAWQPKTLFWQSKKRPLETKFWMLAS